MGRIRQATVHIRQVVFVAEQLTGSKQLSARISVLAQSCSTALNLRPHGA